MFLKKEPFNYQGESTTLNELSALQRIEYLEFMAAEEKALSVESDNISDQEMTARLVGSNIRCGARVIALSLWHNDPTGPTEEALYQQVLKGWPPEAIGKAEMQVKLLSGMLVPVSDEDDDASVTADAESAEPVTAEKPLPAS
ncbi:phage minor tail protein G [Citrobacter koseri]|uniref:phage tail assembly chaperone G n=1 Tax=Citrobacter koseri TaxID=545 RepID=UPI000D7C13D0|nr:phage minor tail protein G [Citrobacter koseri]PYZ79357.1 phage minor tail protein G [Citrobacter koseri]WOJ16068.1 phage minor tail protein G [Citrobacter koseri]WOJ21917.1 phage minor tail protein G [Citrobacter koseri]